jgi:hypothetical protein
VVCGYKGSRLTKSKVYYWISRIGLWIGLIWILLFTLGVISEFAMG